MVSLLSSRRVKTALKLKPGENHSLAPLFSSPSQCYDLENWAAVLTAWAEGSDKAARRENRSGGCADSPSDTTG
ncbi:hypothetical protein LBMAG56_28460 [Verrucomicrobiota bacterium]|nr:hypothetical protein LBMAG56_28460 [Verrucomicrobiota bacterium]